MNETIELLLNHRSIRKFKETVLTKEQIEAIVSCAQAAATSSFLQTYSIIGVEKQELKEKLASLAGEQAYVANNGYFLVFCADLYRHKLIADTKDMDISAPIESTEKFMVATIDATLAAQNAAIAAEAMGLGICYIGGLRNDIEQVNTLLELPEYVIPLFGMCIGYPDQDPGTKPRLPMKNVFHIDKYNTNKNSYLAELKEYDQTISSYYEERTAGKRKDKWTDQVVATLSKNARMNMKEFVQKKGFMKR